MDEWFIVTAVKEFFYVAGAQSGELLSGPYRTEAEAIAECNFWNAST